MSAPGPRPWYWVQTPAPYVKAEPRCVGCGCSLEGPEWTTTINRGWKMPLFAARQLGGQVYRYLVCSIGCAVAVEVRVAVDGEQIDPN